MFFQLHPSQGAQELNIDTLSLKTLVPINGPISTLQFSPANHARYA